jgi:hypothetical protein
MVINATNQETLEVLETIHALIYRNGLRSMVDS